jgi:hypothetical protein
MREKDRDSLRTQKILIRVSSAEKNEVEKMSRKCGENVSEYFRRIISQNKHSGETQVISSIIDEMKSVLTMQRSALDSLLEIQKPGKQAPPHPTND